MKKLTISPNGLLQEVLTQWITPGFAYAVDGGSEVSLSPYVYDGSAQVNFNLPSFSSLDFYVEATDGGTADQIGFNAYGDSTYLGRTDWQKQSYYTEYQYFTREVAAVPEPETYAMLLAGLGLVGAMARRRKQA